MFLHVPEYPKFDNPKHDFMLGCYTLPKNVGYVTHKKKKNYGLVSQLHLPSSDHTICIAEVSMVGEQHPIGHGSKHQTPKQPSG
jgi:hypothetical protein